MRYWSGCATGVSALALALLGYLTLRVMPAQLDMYAEFKAQTLPAVTRLVTSSPWRFGVPLAGLAALAILNAARIEPESRRAVALGIAAALVLAAAAFTQWALFLPISELAGNISGG